MTAVKWTPKARRLLATILSVVAGVMVVGAAGLLLYPKYTDIRATHKQAALRAQFAAASAKLKAAYQPTLSGPSGSQVTLAEGSALTRISVPAIHLDAIVVQGTSPTALTAGIGHYSQTPLPCAKTGNTSYAGHRTMNGHPFQDLPNLKPGDIITLTTPFDVCTYEVVQGFDSHSNPWVTTPNDWTVIAQTSTPTLTLTTCTPEGLATQRYAVRAALVSDKPAANGTSTQ